MSIEKVKWTLWCTAYIGNTRILADFDIAISMVCVFAEVNRLVGLTVPIPASPSVLMKATFSILFKECTFAFHVAVVDFNHVIGLDHVTSFRTTLLDCEPDNGRTESKEVVGEQRIFGTKDRNRRLRYYSV